MANNPLTSKLKNRIPRGLADFGIGAKGPNDPRSYRASMRAGAPKSAGDGLGVGTAGELEVDPGQASLLDTVMSAGAEQLQEAGRGIGLGTPIAWGLHRQASTNAADAIVNDNTERTLYTYTLPEYTLIDLRTVRLRLLGEYLNDSGLARQMTLRVKLGGTTLYDDAITGITNDPAIRPFQIEIVLASLGTSSDQEMWGHLRLGNVAATTTGLGDIDSNPFAQNRHFSSSGSTTIDMTQARALAVTVQHGAVSGSLSIWLRHALLEVY